MKYFLGFTALSLFYAMKKFMTFQFPKRGNRNAKRTEKHKNKMTHLCVCVGGGGGGGRGEGRGVGVGRGG